MKKWMSATMLIWLMACGGDTEGPNPPAEENAVQEGACDVSTDTWDVLEGVQTLAVRGEAWPLESVQTRVLTTEAEEQTFETETGLVFDPVDYDENTVLFATAEPAVPVDFLDQTGRYVPRTVPRIWNLVPQIPPATAWRCVTWSGVNCSRW